MTELSGRQMVIASIVRKMEKATVGTFNPIWDVFCKTIKENNPKNFEKYVNKYGTNK